MIRSFSDQATQKLFLGESILSFGLSGHAARRKLEMLNAAVVLGDLRVPPGNHLEKLRGDRKGWCSIRVNDRWRICFVWRNGHAYEVEIVDYH